MMLTKSIYTQARATDKISKIICIEGSAKDFSTFIIYYDGPSLHEDLVCRTNKDDVLRIINHSYVEDYYENISRVVCQLVTGDPRDTIDPESTELHWMYSSIPS